MSKKGHLTFEKMTLKIWMGVRPHPTHPKQVRHCVGIPQIFFPHILPVSVGPDSFSKSLDKFTKILSIENCPKNCFLTMQPIYNSGCYN